jgi:drug/metabolite transporter (DMT)-like permease
MLNAGALTGELICLTAAMFWALAVMMFRQPIARHGAKGINLAKSLLATLLLAATTLVGGSWHELVGAPSRELWLLGLSGLVGITVGDTALFAAVSRIGVHRSLLLQTLAPVFTALIAFVATGEQLSAPALAGGATILVGVAMVVMPPPGERRQQLVTAVSAGIALATLSALGQGSGVVLAKAGMATVSALPATLFRLAVACAGLMVVLGTSGIATITAIVRDRQNLRRTVPATILGTYLAMMLMMFGISLAPASIAAVLLATTPVFSLVLEAVVDRRRPTPLGIAGTIVAVAGVGILSVLG